MIGRIQTMLAAPGIEPLPLQLRQPLTRSH